MVGFLGGGCPWATGRGLAREAVLGRGGAPRPGRQTQTRAGLSHGLRDTGSTGHKKSPADGSCRPRGQG